MGTITNIVLDGELMTMRDWFAGQALTGLLAIENCPTAENAAIIAYRFADAMLKERDK